MKQKGKMGERGLPEFIRAPQKIFSYLEKKKLVSFRFLTLPAIRYFRRSEDIWKQMEARYTYTAFSIYIAPCQVTGTLKKPVQSPKMRGMVLAAETSVARSALSPQESPVSLQKSSPLPASWPQHLPHAPPTAVRQTEDWDKGGEAMGEQPPSTPTLGLGQLRESFLVPPPPVFRPEPWAGRAGKAQSTPRPLVWSYESSSPTEGNKSTLKAWPLGTNPFCLSWRRQSKGSIMKDLVLDRWGETLKHSTTTADRFNHKQVWP